MRNFDLVQRLEQLPPPRETSSPIEEVLVTAGANGWGAVSPMDSDVDPVRSAGLGFEYMGSSEFEFGAIPQSAHRIVANMSRLAVITSILIRPSYEEPVHFVCTDQQAETLLPVWREWSENPQSREKSHYFRDADGDSVPEGSRTVAWWGLNEDLLWTRDIELAEKIRDGFTQRKHELFAQRGLPKRVLAKLTSNAPQ